MIKEMRIETERLLIRAYKEEDLLECFQLMQNKELFKYLNMDVMSLDEYKGLFNWLIDCYEVGFDGDFKYSFNIILKETGSHIGWCGIGGSEFDHAQKEIYYLIGRAYWGRGYAKEASTALLEYGFNTMGVDKIFALVNPGNIASKCVIENMGLRFQYVITDLPEKYTFYNNHFCYMLTKDEFADKI